MTGRKILPFPQRTQLPTVEIEPHPEDVIDVDPQVLVVMKARLAGESLSDLFSRDDQLSDELAIQREKQKLRAVFASQADVFGGFASLEALKETRAKLREEQVDRLLLMKYASQKLAGQTVDEVDLYAHLVAGSPLRPKQERLKNLDRLVPTLGFKAQRVVQDAASHYVAEGFSAFGVSKEMIELSPALRDMLNGGDIQAAVNEVLQALYGGVE